MTIDAVTPDQLRTRLRATRDGFIAERLALQLPDATADQLAALGPRLTPATIARLRQLVWPATVAALVLALATDREARGVAAMTDHWISDDLADVQMIGGPFRIPARARPFLRAARIWRREHRTPDEGHNVRILLGPDGGAISSPTMTGLLTRASALIAIPAPRAAHSGHGLKTAAPFAADYTRQATIADRPEPP